MYTQVKQPNLKLKGKIGWCLEWVENSYKTPWAGPTAWVAWSTLVKKKHPNMLPPKNVYVPIWFDGYWEGMRYGHVGIYRNGTVWCSPYTYDENPAVLKSIAEVERIYGMNFVGWSEDLGGVDIIKEDIVKPTRKEVIDTFKKYLNGVPSEKQIKHYTTHDSRSLYKDVMKNQPKVNADLVKRLEAIKKLAS